MHGADKMNDAKADGSPLLARLKAWKKAQETQKVQMQETQKVQMPKAMNDEEEEVATAEEKAKREARRVYDDAVWAQIKEKKEEDQHAALRKEEDARLNAFWAQHDAQQKAKEAQTAQERAQAWDMARDRERAAAIKVQEKVYETPEKQETVHEHRATPKYDATEEAALEKLVGYAILLVVGALIAFGVAFWLGVVAVGALVWWLVNMEGMKVKEVFRFFGVVAAVLLLLWVVILTGGGGGICARGLC